MVLKRHNPAVTHPPKTAGIQASERGEKKPEKVVDNLLANDLTMAPMAYPDPDSFSRWMLLLIILIAILASTHG